MLSKAVEIIIIVGVIITSMVLFFERQAEKTLYVAETMDSINTRRMSIYEKYIKRILDVICALFALLCFSPLYILIAILVKNKLGSPVLFTQDRPGLIDKNGKETVFKMYKFRTMTNEKDKEGNLLPDDVRMTKFGRWLRSTSLDELPEVFNILNGTMSIIGPRPQLVRDMVFMTKKQRVRHTAKPGLSGLAQVNGRNAISWDEKIGWDLKYIERICFVEDVKIIINTIRKALFKREGITQENMETAENLGDYLVKTKRISLQEYNNKQLVAKQILNYPHKKHIGKIENKYSVLMSVYIKENADNFKLAIYSMINQTLPPDEIILVEDGPLTNELYQVIKDVKKLYPDLITSVIHKENYGLGIALQHGIEVARNEIVARMDTDDISIPERCEMQLLYLNDNLDISIVGGQIIEFVGDVSNVIGKRNVPLNNDDIKKYMKKRCPFNHMTVMFRKSHIMNVGNYKDCFWNEDFYLWIRLALDNYIFANLPETLVHVRVGYDMYQRRGGLKYFKSEKYLQTMMLKNGIITIPRYLINIVERFIIQILLPNKVRGVVFKVLARK